MQNYVLPEISDFGSDWLITKFCKLKWRSLFCIMVNGKPQRRRAEFHSALFTFSLLLSSSSKSTTRTFRFDLDLRAVIISINLTTDSKLYIGLCTAEHIMSRASSLMFDDCNIWQTASRCLFAKISLICSVLKFWAAVTRSGMWCCSPMFKLMSSSSKYRACVMRRIK